jgi:cystathionine beta-lyase/cystathionine gamma-synthase
MSHASMAESHRKKTGIKDNLIRLSIGLETVDDLIKDLDKALK